MNIHRIKYKDIERVPLLKISQHFKQEFQGSAPAPFIGRFGYPKVNIGILSPQFVGDMETYDSPKLWSQQHMPIGNIASLRYSLVNSRQQWNIKGIKSVQDRAVQEKSHFLDIVQEAGMAKKAVDVEVSLTKPPQLAMAAEREIIPFGPASPVKKARLTSNTNVDTAVEKVVSDTDLKAGEGLSILYNKGFEENSLSKLLSVGTMGIEKNRKLVPTRWSITAVDDTIGKKLIEEVKDFSAGEYQAYFGGGWGNYYLILFFSDTWSYELFETYLSYQKNPWSKQGYAYATDYEGYEGRKQYAEETAGGYYAARLPVLEKMKLLKRQQACLALRFITSEYTIPLGVWVCREAARKSLGAAPVAFSSREELIAYAKQFIANKFQFDLDLLLKESKLLQKKQTKLWMF